MPIQTQTEMVPQVVLLIGIFFLDTKNRKTLGTSGYERLINYCYIVFRGTVNARC